MVQKYISNTDYRLAHNRRLINFTMILLCKSNSIVIIIKLIQLFLSKSIAKLIICVMSGEYSSYDVFAGSFYSVQLYHQVCFICLIRLAMNIHFFM